MSDEYTLSTDEVREAWRTNPDGPKRLGSRFDRWLESVRAEERERIAQAIKTERESVPTFVLTTEGQRAAWKIGMARAFKIAREGA